MYIINKFLERVTRLCRFLMSEGYELNHKYQNKNQTVNTNFILKSLKSKNYNPRYIVDIGCGHGEWTKRMLKYYSKANYLLFDADEENKEKLENLIKKNNNINYQITLLSDDYKKYKFFKMGYGSSIFEEQTSHKREIKELLSKRLIDELPIEISNNDNNMMKLDVQGSELKILNGLGKLINNFEVIILESSIHGFNKNAPLFNEVLNYMKQKDYNLYDLFDFKRIGYDKSFLLQFDCVFVRKNSDLLKVNFG